MYTLLIRNFTTFPCMVFISRNDELIQQQCIIPSFDYIMIVNQQNINTNEYDVNYVFYVLQGWDFVKLQLNVLPFTISMYEKNVDQFYVKIKLNCINNNYPINLTLVSYSHDGYFPSYVTQFIENY